MFKFFYYYWLYPFFLPSYSVSKIQKGNKDEIQQFNELSAFILVTMNLMQWTEINFRSFFKQGFLSLHIFCHCMAWILENKLMNLWYDIISIIVQPVKDATLTTYKITPFSLSEKTCITEFQSFEDFTIHTFHSEINSLKN